MKRKIIFFIWGMCDWLYFSSNRMIYISKEDNIFRVVHKQYTGLPIQTSSGHWLKKGDKILKIHIYNYRLAQLLHHFDSEVQMAIFLRRLIKQSLRGLSNYIYSLPSQYEVKGIVGTTMLNRGAERLGFTIQDVSTSYYMQCKGVLYKLIYLLVHPHGLAYIRKHGQRLQPKHLIMSSEELLQKYLR